MKVNRCRHLFSIGGQLLTFIRKFYEGRQSNFGRRVFKFILSIRNKSPFSGKNNNFLQNWKDVVKFIGNVAETQNRDANHLRWQASTGLGIRVSGPEYRKMEHRETLCWSCCCKKHENRYMSKSWHPSFNGRSTQNLVFFFLGPTEMGRATPLGAPLSAGAAPGTVDGRPQRRMQE